MTIESNSDILYVPPSCDLNAPRGGTIYKKYRAGTGSCVHEPLHRIFRSFVGQHRKMGCCPPARSFTSIQMVHTHTLPQQGRWNENDYEMRMRMR